MSLHQVKAGDHVWIDTQFWSSDPIRTRLSTIEHVDKNGRLYISCETLWGNWRYGFDPDTGKAHKYRNDTMRYASPEEVKAELDRQAAERKAQQDEQERDRQAKLLEAAAPEMFEALEAIGNFWSDYESGRTVAAINPGAYLTERDEPIVDVVRRAIRKARGGK